MNPVIVGGGISGLSAAHYLRKARIASTIIEARPRLGGVIQTEQVDGCVVEHGPDSFLAAKPWAMDLIRELGLEDEVIGSNDHLRKTYIWRHGRLVRMPDGLQLMIPTKLLPMLTTRLLGWSTKLRMASEWFRKFTPRNGDESVAEFIERHYGAEVVHYLAEPLLSGIYGSDPRLLGIQSVLPRYVDLERKYGSLTKGVLAERGQAPAGPLFRSLKRGMGRLIEPLSAEAVVKRGRAEALERHGNAFRVRAEGEWMTASHIVLACEAWRAAELLHTMDAKLADMLASIPYNSSTIAAFGFDRRAVPHPLNGFGFLVPARERGRLAACTWVGTKFSNRAPDSVALLRCFAPGAADESSLLAELRRMMRIDAAPLFTRSAMWPQAMAQYGVGHGGRIAEIEQRLAPIPGVFLAGNAYHGIGIPDCIRSGKQAAEQIAAHPITTT